MKEVEEMNLLYSHYSLSLLSELSYDLEASWRANNEGVNSVIRYMFYKDVHDVTIVNNMYTYLKTAEVS